MDLSDELTCILETFLQSVSRYANMLAVLPITIDRLVAVMYPFL